jgi:hypothetical protein
MVKSFVPTVDLPNCNANELPGMDSNTQWIAASAEVLQVLLAACLEVALPDATARPGHLCFQERLAYPTVCN